MVFSCSFVCCLSLFGGIEFYDNTSCRTMPHRCPGGEIIFSNGFIAGPDQTHGGRSTGVGAALLLHLLLHLLLLLLLLHQLLQLRTYSPAGLTQLTSHLSEPIYPTSFDLFTNLQLLCTQRPAETHNSNFFSFDPSARVAFHHCLDLSQNLSRGKVGNHFPYSSMAARIMDDIDV